MHDPVLIRQDDTYYVFATGHGISTWASKDRKSWKRVRPVFARPPKWAADAVPGFRGHIWAPDISFHNGKYYLYYSVSAFGRNTSCIGLAVNNTLDTASADYGWKDLGKVVQSVPGRDLWNAIDPALVVDEEGTPWLSFGSFWSGIKLVKLNEARTAPAQPEEWHTIARRQRDFHLPDSNPGNAAIEAPFIFRKNGYYYLFVSFDYCCRGAQSNYRIVAGRSRAVAGPYRDKTGRELFLGGGTTIREGDGKRWHGLGHNAVCSIDGKDYLVYHGYDAADEGRSKLIIEELQWDAEGWPVAKGKQ